MFKALKYLFTCLREEGFTRGTFKRFIFRMCNWIQLSMIPEGNDKEELFEMLLYAEAEID